MDTVASSSKPPAGELKGLGLNSGAGASYEEELSDKLELLLSQAEGVGEVSVLIQVKGSSERIIEKDEPYTERVSNDRTDAGTAGSSRETASHLSIHFIVIMKSLLHY